MSIIPITSKTYPFPINMWICIVINALNYSISVIAVSLNFAYASCESAAHIFYYPLLPKIDPKDKAIFITGCASGFGFKLAQKLDSMGYTVFAGCRKIDEERTRNLENSTSNRLQLVKCDVTSDEDVNQAVDLVRSKLNGKRLWALVSNAGMTNFKWNDWGRPGVAVDEEMININVLGSVRLTKAFLPMLRATKGSRVVLVSSSVANISTLCTGSYSMTKAALSSFGNSLRRELKHWDIHVSIIEPTAFRTPLTDPRATTGQMFRNWEETPEEIKKEYTTELKMRSIEATVLVMELANTDISPAVDAMVEAITCPQKPAAFYTPSYLIENMFLTFIFAANTFFTDLALSLPVVLPVLKMIAGLKKGPQG